MKVKNNFELKLTDFDGVVLNCAVRYCLGRQSYMPSLVIDQITPILKHCDDRTLWCFEKDVQEYLNSHGKCFEDILEAWQIFLKAVIDEQQNRTKDKK